MQSTSQRIVSTDDVNGVRIVRFLEGRIGNEAEVHRTLGELGAFIEEHPGSRLLVNLEYLEYLSSAGLGNLVGLLKKSHKTHGAFRLCCLQESIRQLFEVMRLDRIFKILDTEEEALRSF
jgi:anti-anti-sigma factor